MRLNLIFGFLGSGKTTLLRRILEGQAGDGARTAVIVNEFGDVGIDGAILRGSAVDMVELSSGCLCCMLKGPLLAAIEELGAREGVERVVVEASGVAHPDELLDTLEDPSLGMDVELGPLVTVVDVAKFPKIRDMLGEFYTSQIELSDVLVLNKTDLASAAELAEVRESIAELNEEASTLLAERCEVEIPLVLDGRRPAPEGVSALSHGHDGHAHESHGHHDHEHRHAPADSAVADASGDLDRAALERLFASLPETLWRAKGFAVVDGVPSLVQYAMGELEIVPTEPREHAHLVFIGEGVDAAALGAGVDACRRGTAS